MKSIEQKLKKKLVVDAQAFKQDPAPKLHESIMQNVEGITHQNSQNQQTQHNNSSRTFNWLLPTGLASAALLVAMMNLIPVNNQHKIIDTSDQNKLVVKMPEVDVKALSLSLESSLISGITAEKKALQADLNYMKSLFSLKKSKATI